MHKRRHRTMNPSPAEQEPDGEIGAFHHWWTGILLMIGGFVIWQPQYSPLGGAVLCGVGLLVALDDYLSHAFGIWTPLDAGFRRAMEYKRLRRAYRAINSRLPKTG